ncbi:hypothetical protein WDH52_10860 [Streptomyces sp. TRM70308]|uniref:hypothetical protein n=1 Tax=Streptomyces sp. TRM70308 TaxID=3131932 RepID=UPI003CFE61D3
MLGLAALVAVAGCASEGEPYAVPERVCGVEMKEEVVRALLPEGEELAESGKPLPAKFNYCTLVVDGEPELWITFGTVGKLYRPLEEYPRQFEDGDEIALGFAGYGGVDDDNARISAECGLPERPSLAGNVRVSPPGGGPGTAPRSDLERFVVDYMAGAKRELGCPS